MANPTQVLAKIARNLKQRGYTAEDTGTVVNVTKSDSSVLVVSYVSKDVQSPMGGVSPASSPFLGAGVQAPGSLKIKGAAGDTSLALIFSDAVACALLAELAGFANDIVIESGDSTAQLARIMGSTDALGLGS